MHDTRLQVLQTIKNQRQATVASLSEAMGLTPISIRHHLTSLQVEGLVSVEIERQGVGRPHHIYALTDEAMRFFPTKYHVLAERLLDELKATLPPEQVEHIIDGLAANVAAQHGSMPMNGPLENRLQHLVEILGEEGFKAEVRHVDNKIVLTEVNCPYLYVGQRHPEVCRIDHALIRSVLGAGVEQTTCVLHGDSCCTFSVNEEAAAP